jgi:hypothetical protein
MGHEFQMTPARCVYFYQNRIINITQQDGVNSVRLSRAHSKNSFWPTLNETIHHFRESATSGSFGSHYEFDVDNAPLLESNTCPSFVKAPITKALLHGLCWRFPGYRTHKRSRNQSHRPNRYILLPSIPKTFPPLSKWFLKTVLDHRWCVISNSAR